MSSIGRDQELLNLLREQPVQGMAALYDAFGRLVYSVAFRIVGEQGAAEEITQDVFLRCWHNIDRYKPQYGSLSTWLASIARNRAVDELRSRRGRESRREVSDDLLGSVASVEPIDELLTRHTIQQALEQLPPAQREVVELAYWGGLTRREIAEQLDLPLGTVHTRLRLAMDRLRLSIRMKDES